MKRNIKVKESELVNRLNAAVEGKKRYEKPVSKYVATVDTATGKDWTDVTVWTPQWDRELHGEICKDAESIKNQDTPEQPTDDWDKFLPTCEKGEVTINLDPIANKGDDVIELTDEAKDWAVRDSLKDAEESRANDYSNNALKSAMNKVREDLELKRLKKDPAKISAMKKALGLNEDTQSRTHYEEVNHPQHYNNYDVEVVDMMEKIWGTKATMEWCKMTAYKYRMRMGTKPAEDDTREAMQKKLMEDFNKEQWYLAKAKELSSKLFDQSIDMNN